MALHLISQNSHSDYVILALLEGDGEISELQQAFSRVIEGHIGVRPAATAPGKPRAVQDALFLANVEWDTKRKAFLEGDEPEQAFVKWLIQKHGFKELPFTETNL